MTDIDIERLREKSQSLVRLLSHWEGCVYEHQSCAVLALIERLSEVEADFKHVSREYSKANSLISDYKAKALVEHNRRERAEAQRDLLREQLNRVLDRHWKEI